jgi:hypothetical protein
MAVAQHRESLPPIVRKHDAFTTSKQKLNWLLSFIPTLQKLIPSIGLEAATSKFLDEVILEGKRFQHELQRDKLVVVLGEKKNGKSTLLNVILEELLLFSQSTKTATGAITRVYSDGNEKCIKVYIKGKPTPEVFDFAPNAPLAEFKAVVRNKTSFDTSREEIIELVDVCWPNKFLQGGAVIVDTPGINDAKLNNLVESILPAADAVILVCNGTRAITAEVISTKILIPVFRKQSKCSKPLGIKFLSLSTNGMLRWQK